MILRKRLCDGSLTNALTISRHGPVFGAADLYSVVLQQVLPSFPVPLKLNDPEPSVPLQEIFNGVYERARYRTRIDYHLPVPPPALSEADKQWVEALLAPIRDS